VAVGTTVLSLQAPFTVTGGYGPTLGYDASANPPIGSNGPTVYYSTAAPGKPTIVFFDLWNLGPMPVRLDGLVADLTEGFDGAGVIALALPADPNAFRNRLDQLVPFTPSVVAPNEWVRIFLVGRAGSCAFGPGYQPGVSDSTAYASRVRTVRLGYSILGLSSTTDVEMPMQLVEPAAVHCPPG
jgi:hypothetical protein